MSDILPFYKFKIMEEIDTKLVLYRLVAVESDEPLVVDTKNPGKYYFKNEKDVTTEVLKKKGDEYHIIKVTVSSSNIDEDLSKEESQKHGCDCVVLKDDSKIEYEGTEPFK